MRSIFSGYKDISKERLYKGRESVGAIAVK